MEIIIKNQEKGKKRTIRVQFDLIKILILLALLSSTTLSFKQAVTLLLGK